MRIDSNRSLRVGALILPLLTACVGTSAVRSLPLHSGVRAEYRASRDSVLDAVPPALGQVGQGVVEQIAPDSVTDLVIGKKGVNLLSWGEVSRVQVSARVNGNSRLYAVARPRYLLDWSGWAGRSAIRTVAAVDKTLGPDRLALFEGAAVRGATTDDGAELQGQVIVGSDGLFSLLPDENSDVALPMGSLSNLEILRGSWRHGAEGAFVGAVIGTAAYVALLAKATECVVTIGYGSACREDTSGLELTALLSPIVGFLVGSIFRTEVWSPILPSRAPGRPMTVVRPGGNLAEMPQAIRRCLLTPAISPRRGRSPGGNRRGAISRRPFG